MKRSVVIAMVSVLGVLAAGAQPALAAVNCGIVKKDLDRGKKAEDIAERMGISVADVDQCKRQGGTGTTAPPAPASNKGAAPEKRQPIQNDAR